MLAQNPIETPGGRVRITDPSNFPVSKTIAAALVEIEPGATRAGDHTLQTLEMFRSHHHADISLHRRITLTSSAPGVVQRRLHAQGSRRAVLLATSRSIAALLA